jgi:hypothetical protein
MTDPESGYSKPKGSYGSNIECMYFLKFGIRNSVNNQIQTFLDVKIGTTFSTTFRLQNFSAKNLFQKSLKLLHPAKLRRFVEAYLTILN